LAFNKRLILFQIFLNSAKKADNVRFSTLPTACPKILQDVKQVYPEIADGFFKSLKKRTTMEYI